MGADRLNGHLDLVLLSVLAGGPAHGYAVICGVRDRTHGSLDLSEGAVYPALHRLEDAGLLVSDWHPVAGRRRRVYQLTDQGAAALRAGRRDWLGLVAAVEAVLTPARTPRAVTS
jgi:DNA-binding PadR family transcriptional regulator